MAQEKLQPLRHLAWAFLFGYGRQKTDEPQTCEEKDTPTGQKSIDPAPPCGLTSLRRGVHVARDRSPQRDRGGPMRRRGVPLLVLAGVLTRWVSLACPWGDVGHSVVRLALDAQRCRRGIGAGLLRRIEWRAGSGFDRQRLAARHDGATQRVGLAGQCEQLVELSIDDVEAVTLAAYEQYAAVIPALWEAYRANILATLAAAPPSTRIVAEEEERVVGSVLLYPADNRARPAARPWIGCPRIAGGAASCRGAGSARPRGVIRDPAAFCPNPEESCGPDHRSHRNLDSSDLIYTSWRSR